MISSTINALDTINTLPISSIYHTGYTERTNSFELVPTDPLNFFIITKAVSDWQL